MENKVSYNPVYFLASLGAGGLSVSFFMYLMFLTDKGDRMIPTFDMLAKYFSDGNMIFMIFISIAFLFILGFGILHLYLLFWNIKKYREFKKTKDFKAIKTTNAEITLMTIPLTLAMTINVMFVFGALFIPKLWNIIEYMFPFAIIGFILVGIYALKIFGEYISRIIVNGDFNFSANNNFGQLIAIFAFSMIAVGLAAPAAMSEIKLTVGISLILSIFFLSIAVLFAFIKLTIGFKSILEHGLAKEQSASLWILIPILTLIGITVLRQYHGIHIFGGELEKHFLLIFTTIIVSLQIIFGYIGYKVMKTNGYFEEFLNGKEKSVGSFALICPGVAFFVFGMFFVHIGLVQNGIIEMFGISHFILLSGLLYLQIITIHTMLKLNKKLL